MTTEKRRGHEILIEAAKTSAGQNAQADTGAFSAPDARTSGTDVLKVDGAVVPYTKCDGGFSIYYLPPASSLAKAARAYVDIQPEVEQ